MRYFFNFICFKRLVLSCILCAFPLAVLMPHSVYGQPNLNVTAVNFGIKMQKLIDKAWKYYTKEDGDSLVDVILDIKMEVEAYTGNKINVEKEIDKIERDLIRKGHNSPKGTFKSFKDLIKKKIKKKSKRSLCMETYFLDSPKMTFEEYEALYLAIGRKQENEKEKNELPLKFVVGVSLILGGAFVMFATPVCPVLGYTGEIMMSTGFGMMIDQGLGIYQKEY